MGSPSRGVVRRLGIARLERPGEPEVLDIVRPRGRRPGRGPFVARHEPQARARRRDPVDLGLIERRVPLDIRQDPPQRRRRHDRPRHVWRDRREVVQVVGERHLPVGGVEGDAVAGLGVLEHVERRRPPVLRGDAVGRHELRGTEADEAGDEAGAGEAPQAPVAHHPGEHDRAAGGETSRLRAVKVGWEIADSTKETTSGTTSQPRTTSSPQTRAAERSRATWATTSRAAAAKAATVTTARKTARRGEVEVRLEARRGERDEDLAERGEVGRGTQKS